MSSSQRKKEKWLQDQPNFCLASLEKLNKKEKYLGLRGTFFIDLFPKKLLPLINVALRHNYQNTHFPFQDGFINFNLIHEVDNFKHFLGLKEPSSLTCSPRTSYHYQFDLNIALRHNYQNTHNYFTFHNLILKIIILFNSKFFNPILIISYLI